MANDSMINFGGNLRFAPRRFYTPGSEAELLTILDRHARGKVRVVGAQHSWSALVLSDDTLINMSRFNDVRIDGNLVTVGGGCRVRRLLRKLHRHSCLTMPSIGLIAEQTIAGAISTATHGSGRHSLSHYMEELCIAGYDADGNACLRTVNRGEELRAARCSLGAIGVIVSVSFRAVPRYDVAETLTSCDTLDEALESESMFPLQQFFLLPQRWTFVVQRRSLPEGLSERRAKAILYRFYMYFGIDVGLHCILKLLASFNCPLLTRWFFRRLMLPGIIRNVTVVDRAERMLIMKHELFRHQEMELFVPSRHLPAATRFVIDALSAFAGDAPTAELLSLGFEVKNRGSFTHHYPICVRRILPDDAMISTASGGIYYSISFIALGELRREFNAMTAFLAQAMAKLFDARPHWGKLFPLDAATVERLYPELPAFRKECQRLDPLGVFRNLFVDEKLALSHLSGSGIGVPVRPAIA